MADEVEKDKPEVPETPDASPASEPERLVEQSVIPPKKTGSRWWYAVLIIIVLAAGYYSYTGIFSAPETTQPTSPATGAAAGTPSPEPTATTTPVSETGEAETAPAETTEPAPAETTYPACSDSNACTLDYFDTATNACANVAIPNCCGNNICESSERCTTICEDDNCKITKQQTVCKLDCPLSCPANVAVHKLADKYSDRDVQNPKTFTCESTNCEQLDDIEFKFTGLASVKTYISNLGEQASDIVTSQFSCSYEFPQYNEPSATKDGDVLGRLDQKVRVLDYFNGNRDLQESASLSAQQSVGGQTATYSFAVEPVDAKYSTTLLCTVWLRSGDFTDQQDLKIRYVPA